MNAFPHVVVDAPESLKALSLALTVLNATLERMLESGAMITPEQLSAHLDRREAALLDRVREEIERRLLLERDR